MSALVIFSRDVPRLAQFYQRLLGATASTESSGDIRVITDVDEVLIHSIPKGVAAKTPLRTPPASRDDAALKPVFEVQSLSDALQTAAANGGMVTDRTFRIDGMTRHDVVDPDGNVIQLRSASS